MTNPTLSLECSRKLYELLGEMDANKYWVNAHIDYWEDDGSPYLNGDKGISPTYDLWFGRKPLPHHVIRWNTKEPVEEKEREMYAQITFIPTFNFSELIRLLPKIGEKKGWKKDVLKVAGGLEKSIGDEDIHAGEMVYLYMHAPTSEQGMEEVSKYLLSIL